MPSGSDARTMTSANDRQGAMRSAARQAGLIDAECSERLQLALEPEAACIACQHDQQHLREGDAFMVLDCGGGTVDITTHRVIKRVSARELQLAELAPPAGDALGSTFVDAEFDKLLEDLVGEAAFARFKVSADWVDMKRTWEASKLAFDLDADVFIINVGPIMEVC